VIRLQRVAEIRCASIDSEIRCTTSSLQCRRAALSTSGFDLRLQRMALQVERCSHAVAHSDALSLSVGAIVHPSRGLTNNGGFSAFFEVSGEGLCADFTRKKGARTRRAR
jgi:hypothetical protein